MKCFKLIGIISLIIFSFFLTDFVTDIAINNNSLMKSIKENSINYQVESVNAIIDNNTIIPGIKGKKVNCVESYLNMKDFGAFNKNYLVYESFFPEISIEDNKDKVIISGNKKNRSVSLLINNNNEIINYSNKHSIKFTKLIKMGDELINKDNINIESTKENFKNLNVLLNKNKLNNNICLINYSNIEECIKKEQYLVKYNIEISNNLNNINKIENGSIIYVGDNLSLENYIILIKYIKNKDLKITYLSDLIKE